MFQKAGGGLNSVSPQRYQKRSWLIGRVTTCQTHGRREANERDKQTNQKKKQKTQKNLYTNIYRIH